MLFLSENAAAIAVAAVVSLMGWLFGGTRGDLLVVVAPWILVILAEIMICFPQRYSYETSYDARERVWRDLRRDPLVWVALGFGLMMLVPFVNTGLCAQCDGSAIAAGADPKPPLPFLPFCVDVRGHLNTFLWFATGLLVALAAKHSLARRGKRLALALIVWNGTLLAVLGFVQHGMGAPGPLWSTESGLRPTWPQAPFFSTFGYCNMAGSYFTMLFGLAVALWRDCCERFDELHAHEEKDGSGMKMRHTFWKRHFYLIPASLLFYAALNTLSRAAILLSVITAVIYFFHAFVCFMSKRDKIRRAWSAVWSLLGLCLVVLFALTYTPDDVRKELNTVDAKAVLDRTSGKGVYQSGVAIDIWKDNILFGCGGWGYRHFCVAKLTPAQVKLQREWGIGSTNVHNDYLQFLAEHGTIGFGALVAFTLLLLWPVFGTWSLLVKSYRFKRKDRPPSPVQIFALPAPAFCILTACVTVLIHAFGDCPLRSLAVLSLFFVSLAAIPGFLPKRS